MTARPANAAERRLWDRIVSLGCAVGPSVYCEGRLMIHHCGTGAGGRKDHTKVLCLCWGHHQGPEGIDSKSKDHDGLFMNKRRWQEKYGSEIDLMAETHRKLEQHC